MRLKCIGGPCDGERIQIDPHERDAWPYEMTPLAATAVNFDPTMIPETTQMAVRHHYTKRSILAGREPIFFLAPVDMSDADALRKAVT